jgi:hypothetical protein
VLHSCNGSAENGRQKIVKDENGKVKTELGYRPVYESIIHGKKTPPKDLVNEYRRIAYTNKKSMGEKEGDAYILPIKGYFDKANVKNSINALNYDRTFKMWVWEIKDGEMGPLSLLTIKPSVKDAIVKMCKDAPTEKGSDVITTDPFSDIEEGVCLKIVFNPNALKATEYYSVYKDDMKVKETIKDHKGVERTFEIDRKFPLSDEKLEELFEQDSLEQIFRAKFGFEEFKIQVEGLRLFEEKNQMGIFDSPEFQAIVEELAQFWKEGEEETPPVVPTEEVIEQAKKTETAEGDIFSSMQMEDLIDYIEENDCGIRTKGLKGKEIKVLLRKWKKEKETTPIEVPIPEVVEIEEEKGEEVQEEVEDEAEKARKARMERLNALASRNKK